MDGHRARIAENQTSLDGCGVNSESRSSSLLAPDAENAQQKMRIQGDSLDR